MNAWKSLSRWYRRWVQLYPNPFRAQYAGELVLLFEETWRDYDGAGTSDRLRFLAVVAWDGVRSLIKEWSAALNWQIKVVAAGTALLVLLDFASHFYSGLANAVYFWGSMAVACSAIHAVRHRHWSIVAVVAALMATALYFCASGLSAFAPGPDWHARFGELPDVVGIALALFAVLTTLNSPREPTQIKKRRFFGDRPLIVCLQLLCFGCAFAGMIRYGLFHRNDDTSFLLVVGNAVFSTFQSRWSRPVNAASESIA